jgi:hypothetical protein
MPSSLTGLVGPGGSATPADVVAGPPWSRPGMCRASTPAGSPLEPFEEASVARSAEPDA